MQRFDIWYLFRTIFLLLLIYSDACIARQQPVNIISPTDNLTHLRYWLIAPDQARVGPLRIPSDSLWLPLYPTAEDEEYREGNWLLTTDLAITDSVDSSTAWGLFLAYLTTAYEVYWDGTKIAQNGVIGTDKATESPGALRCSVTIPAHLMTGGKHTILLRVSHYHGYSSWRWFYSECSIGPYDLGLKSKFQAYYKSFFVIGILIIPLVLNLLLYFGREKRTEHILFSLICLTIILDSLTNLFPAFVEVSTTYVHLEVYAYNAFSMLFACVFPSFIASQFDLPKGLIGVVLAINLVVFFFISDLLNVFALMALTVLSISSLMTLWALWKRKEESIIISIGMLAGWVAYYFNVAFDGLAAVMVVCTSISIGRQFVRSERTEREAQIRSAHLENELLRKQINPHFLLNTLTSIIVWLRKDPKSAIVLVEALAEEFRMILKISGLKQISMKQEIELCKTHLTIMNLRKGATFTLETVDLVEEESVPPMLFHTIIENGLTHGYEGRTEGRFVLQRKSTPEGLTYVLSNDGNFKDDMSRDSTGFGFRYFKGRLEESYPGRWSFTSHELDHGWESIIEIKEK